MFTFKEDPSFVAYNYIENNQSLTANRSVNLKESAWNFLTICYEMSLFFKKFLSYPNIRTIMSALKH